MRKSKNKSKQEEVIKEGVVAVAKLSRIMTTGDYCRSVSRVGIPEEYWSLFWETINMMKSDLI